MSANTFFFMIDFLFFLTRMAKMHNSEPLNSTLFRQNKKHMKFEFDKLDCIGFPNGVGTHLRKEENESE